MNVRPASTIESRAELIVGFATVLAGSLIVLLVEAVVPTGPQRSGTPLWSIGLAVGVVLSVLYAVGVSVARRLTRGLREQVSAAEHLALHDGMTNLPNRRAAPILPTAVIANSRTTLDTLPPVRRSWVVPSPIDVRPTDRSAAPGPLRFGILGRIAPWKGQDVFLSAFARAFPGGDELASVIGAPLFGSAEETYASELGRLATELGVRERVAFTGFVEDVGVALGDLDVLVHASLLPEPFGQVVAEGMALGLPVVAASAGGPAEVIEDGVTGVLYSPGDVDALAVAMTQLASDSELRDRISAAARRRAEEFQPHAVASRIIAVYESVLGPTSSNPALQLETSS